MEFIQFHPTALRLPGVQPFLISEAMRGEGGVLLDTNGARFMPEYHSRAELAPRDIVARAIVERMQATGSDHVLLDMTQLGADRMAARFPQIYHFCLEAGLDITREPIPVSPAAHYTMGGVRTNVWGESTVPGLYACGECACAGVHGANRLASNSLLETVVFAKRVVQRTLESPEMSAVPSPALSGLGEPEQGEAEPFTKPALQEMMWQDVGIVRDRERLVRAKAVLSAWAARALTPSPSPAAPGEGGMSSHDSLELADLLTCARLVTEAALMREESRGAHFRRDFPAPREEWRHHLVWTNR
jgi:L-aspartate oxidase